MKYANSSNTLPFNYRACLFLHNKLSDSCLIYFAFKQLPYDYFKNETKEALHTKHNEVIL